ncbi:MAG: hypothetical protein ACYC5N_00435 [Endomicrobiales bacterium]
MMLFKNRLDAGSKLAALICLHADRHFSFAVDSFYEDFPDLTNAEVISLLARRRQGARAGVRK